LSTGITARAQWLLIVQLQLVPLCCCNSKAHQHSQ
jgi:hypothetical protein